MTPQHDLQTEATPAPETVLELRDVSFAYGKRPVLQGLSGRFARGETTAILGLAGSGKTTLTSLVGGFHHPDRGEIVSSGTIAPVIGPAGGMGHSNQTLRDLGLRAAAYGLDTDAYAEALAGIYGSTSFLTHRFDSLPTLERTSMGRAAALMVPADVYISDGQILAGDERLMPRLSQLLEMRQRTAAVIWITATATALLHQKADRFAILHGGQLTFLPTKRDVFLAYQSVGGVLHPAILRSLGQ